MNLKRVFQMNGRWYAVWRGRQQPTGFDSKAQAIAYLDRCDLAKDLIEV